MSPMDIGFRIEAPTMTTPITSVDNEIIVAEPGDVTIAAIVNGQSRTLVMPHQGALALARELMKKAFVAEAQAILTRPRESDR